MIESKIVDKNRPHNKKRLGDLLFEVGVITKEGLNKALDEQRKTGKRLGEMLISLGIVSELMIAQTLASQLGYKYINLNEIDIEPEAFLMIPESLARKHLAVPIGLKNKSLTVAMVDPLDYESIKDLGFHSGLEINPVIASRKEILDTIEKNYLDTSLEHIVQETQEKFDESLLQIIPDITTTDEIKTIEERARLAPIIKLANLIMTKAIKSRASDIHIEPSLKGLKVRYRIDGLLNEEMQLPKWVQNPLISRIKVLASLDIAERRMPQDGAVRVRSDHREIDLRVSCLPTQYGEKVVIRILDQSRQIISLETLGLSKKNLPSLNSLIRKRKGLILVTGPTGSGKSTTLYSIINRIKSETTNILTVEDPIEYSIEGINQTQVNPDMGLTFTRCLKSILRQDPNIILIGEIRDNETAEIAFRAAMTGHLVLSTLHTGDAPSTITRLIDIGIPRFLVASLLMGVIAQRLIRCVCPRCKEPTQPPIESLISLNIPPDALKDTKFFYGKGCGYCNSTGYQGRLGLFEILILNTKIREMISANASEQDIRAAALAEKMLSLGEDGLNKVREGITTIEELVRVIEVEEGLQTICHKCSRYIHIDFLACPYCGTTAAYHCASCGKPLQQEWIICPYCKEKIIE